MPAGYTFLIFVENLIVMVYMTSGAAHLRDVFYRMSLTDKDIVALSGGHTLVI